MFYTDRGITYCRQCAGFSRLDLGQRPPVPELKTPVWKGKVHLDFPLTELQKAASENALAFLQQGKDVFVYAAAGAGKTEMTLAAIDWFLRQGKKVGFAISRRQVVLEIAVRLRKNFPGLDVAEVCQDYTRKTDGDLIVCTMHQLYRYPHGFDLLIMDELDAFPYADSQLLHKLAEDACKGVKLMLSATPDAQIMQDVHDGKCEMITLFKRPHGKPIPEPVIMQGPVWLQLVLIFLALHRLVRQEHRQVLLFVPRRKDARLLAGLLARFMTARAIHSQSTDRDALMEAFRNREFSVLVSTTLLERGITVPSVQVVVFRADHPVFTAASLIQIFGRAGRAFHEPEGECLCFCQHVTPSVRKCTEQLRMMNRSA